MGVLLGLFAGLGAALAAHFIFAIPLPIAIALAGGVIAFISGARVRLLLALIMLGAAVAAEFGLASAAASARRPGRRRKGGHPANGPGRR